MIVKEVKDKIEKLRGDYKNLIKLQDWIIQNQNDQDIKNVVDTLEEGSNINCTMRGYKNVL